MIAPTFFAAVAIVALPVLHFLNIDIGNDQLMTTLTTLFTIASGLLIAYRQWANKRSTLLGTRPAGFQQ